VPSSLACGLVKVLMLSYLEYFVFFKLACLFLFFFTYEGPSFKVFVHETEDYSLMEKEI
jgi:hypothetical protein